MSEQDGSVSATEVVMLGSGTPNADPARSGPALAVVTDGVAYLVDCGPGLVRRAAAAAERGKSELTPALLSRLFVTHLHSDHTAGLPDLLLTPWVLGRDRPLEAWGPPGLAEMGDHVAQAYAADVRERIEGLERANPIGCTLRVHEISPGLVWEDEHIKVSAFLVEHGSWAHAFGYRFETRDRVIVVSGDTRPCAALEEHAAGCDVLLHEVYCERTFAQRSPQWQEYHASFHTSSRELAVLAQRVRPRLLVLTHLLLWGATEEELLEEIQSVYDGPVVCGEDLAVY